MKKYLIMVLWICLICTGCSFLGPTAPTEEETPGHTEQSVPTVSQTPIFTAATTKQPATTASSTSEPTIATAMPATPTTAKPTPTTTTSATKKPATPTLAPTATPTPATPKPTLKPTTKPTPKPTPTAPQSQGPLKGLVIGIDPGHQGKGNSQQEPVAPGASETKKKVSSGTQGKWSRVPEYKVVLTVGLQLKTLLEQAGATVIMSRETNDVDISNAQRAVMMNEANADLVLRIHCNGSNNPAVYGACMLIPAGESTKNIQAVSKEAGQIILNQFTAVTGAKNNGLVKRSDLTGFNWSTVPVCLIEMGYMSNQEEDALLTAKAYQEKCASGLYQGILQYFKETKKEP